MSPPQHLTTTTFYTQHINISTQQHSYGRHAGAAPHFDGFGPITSSSVPPWRMSLKSMYEFFISCSRLTGTIFP